MRRGSQHDAAAARDQCAGVALQTTAHNERKASPPSRLALKVVAQPPGRAFRHSAARLSLRLALMSSNVRFTPKSGHCIAPQRMSALCQKETSTASFDHLVSAGHSRIASARAKNASGTMRPMVFALFRLTASSNFVGCSMGKSFGRSPCRILCTNLALSRNKAGPSAP